MNSRRHVKRGWIKGDFTLKEENRNKGKRGEFKY